MQQLKDVLYVSTTDISWKEWRKENKQRPKYLA